MTGVEMTIQGLLALNETELIAFEEVASQHVRTYWNDLTSSSGVVVSLVTTSVTFQQETLARKRRRLQQGGAATISTRFVYDQEITYGIVTDNSPVQSSLDMLFFRPFSADSQRFLNDLRSSLFLTNQFQDLRVVSIGSMRVPTAAPSTQPTPSPPTPQPTLVPASNTNPNNNTENRRNSNTAIVVIIVVLVVVVLVVVFVVGYFVATRREQFFGSSDSRQRQQQQNQGRRPQRRRRKRGNKKELDDDQSSVVELPQPGTNKSQHHPSMYSYEESDIDPYSVEAGSYRTNPDGSSFGVPSEIGGVGSESNFDDEGHHPLGSALGPEPDNSMEDDFFGMPAADPSQQQQRRTPQNASPVSSSFGSMDTDDKEPSLSGFNLQIRHLDD